MFSLFSKFSLRDVSILIVAVLVLVGLAWPLASNAGFGLANTGLAPAASKVSRSAIAKTSRDGNGQQLQQPLAPQAVTTTFTNSTAITIPSAPSAFPLAATPYPSNITVSGVGTTLSAVTLTINGFHHTQQKDVDALLVGPTGAKFIFMSDVGGANVAPPTIDLTFDDAAANQAPITVINATSTFKPTNSGAGDTFAGAPAGPYNEAAPAGSATFASVFTGTDPNGVWSLYIFDDAGGDIGAFNGGWTLNITTAAAATGTTTTVSSLLNPSLTTGSATFTAHVVKTSDSSNVTLGSVTFVDSSTGTTLASNVALNGSGLASTAAIGGLTERRHLITATYNPDPAFLTSTGTLFQTVDFPTSNPSAGVYANTNSVTIPDPAGVPPGGGPAVQYPSHITVSGLSGIVSNVSVSLKNVTHTATGDLDILLVGPGGQNLILLSDSGGSNSNITVNFDDNAANQLPASGSWGASGSTFLSKPVNYVAGDTWPTPAPASGYNSPSPIGSSTLNGIFGGTSPNGVWSLYIFDDAGGDSGAMAGGWSLTFTVTSSLTWNGGSSANWDTPANWTPAVAPSALLDAVIPASGVTNEPTISATDVAVSNLTIAAGRTLTVNSGRTLTVNGTATVNGSFAGTGGIFSFNNLTIGNAAGVTLGGNALVNNALALTAGDLNMGANTLTQPFPGISTGTFDVIGKVRISNVLAGVCGSPPCPNTMRFGNPDNQITVTAGPAFGDITVALVKSAPVGFAGAVHRTYTITSTPSNPSPFTATVRLHYLDTELGTNTEAALGLRRFNGTGWAPYPATASSTVANWVENNAVHNFSPWTLSSSSPTAAQGEISGRITTSDGKPIEGAVVRLSGGQTRKLITDADGNYRFENVDPGGFYTVTPSRVNYNFNPFNRSFSQVGNQTEAVFMATSTGDSVNPLDTAEYFVRQQYLDVLLREPDESGFNYWSDQINQCLSVPATAFAGPDDCLRVQRTGVAAAFFIEQEAQQTGSYIYDVYAGTLGRRPVFSEYSLDRQGVVGGATLETAKTAFAQQFVQRTEFVTKYQGSLTAESFVDAVLQSVQSSGVDLSGERQDLIAIYNQGNQGADLISSRAAVVRTIADHATFKQSQYNRAFVLTEYFSYLRRDPEAAGYNFWVGVLNTGDAGNYRGMVCSFVTSAEYQHRFSSAVSHTNSECGQ